MARPTAYSPELAQVICDRLANDESLASICREAGMPSRNTVYAWRREHDEFADNYVRARQDQGETTADNIGEIRALIASGELDPAAGRVIIDALKWEAGKRLPKLYGDKATIDHNHAFTEEVSEWLGHPKS